MSINFIQNIGSELASLESGRFSTHSSNFRNPPGNIDSDSGNSDIIGGANIKQYVKLQSGRRRVVRYGKRGGKYYMKGGKKHYIK